MMISITEARFIAEEIARRSGRKLIITSFSELHDENDFESLYLFSLKDEETGQHYYPGELFPSIRKGDGKLVDFSLPPPGKW